MNHPGRFLYGPKCSWLICVACVFVLGCGSDKQEVVADLKSSSDLSSQSTLEDNKPTAVVTKEEPKGIEFGREELLAKADRHQAAGKLNAAFVTLQKVLVADPDDQETLFRMATIQAERGDYENAIASMKSISSDHPKLGVASLGLSADWCMKVGRYDEAEERYRKILDVDFGQNNARRSLAYLLNRQGRRHEAVKFIQQLCAFGDIRQDEMHALISVGDAMHDDEQSGDDKERPYYPIGASGRARKLMTDGAFDDAAKVLYPVVASGKGPQAVVAMYGRAIAEAQDDDGFAWWINQTDEQTEGFAEYWSAIGVHLLTQRRYEESVRAFAEAIRRDPTDVGSIRRIRQALISLDKNELAGVWMDRFVSVRETIRASNRIGRMPVSDPADIRKISSELVRLQRPMEAVVWQSIGAFHQKQSQQVFANLNAQRQTILKSKQSFPDTAERLCGLDYESFPLPKMERAAAPSPTLLAKEPVAKEIHASVATLIDVAEASGLQHTYRVAKEPQALGYAIYQQWGGGVCVLDFDLDGAPDLFLAQAGSDAPDFVADLSSTLYRNVDRGQNWMNVTQPANVIEHDYSIGVTAGDWNQDGFDDLVIANLGANVMLINNGDGTFRKLSFADAPTTQVTTSLAMADVTGDSLPDLVEVNYIDDELSAEKPEVRDGKVVESFGPLKYKPAMDLIHQSDRRGGWTTTNIGDAEDAASSGLGIVVANFDDRVGNEIFVGNDLRPNQFWSSDSPRVDRALITGCGFGSSGAATASMGIAVGDFDGNDAIDIHVTNYESEPVSLFLNRDGGFVDRNVQYQLNRESQLVLGFGSQAIDYDNNGALDLVVSNGHVDDAVGNLSPLKQSPQLFAGGRVFKSVTPDDESSYFHQQHVGRALARVDFNVDGRDDFVVTHLESPTALIENRTASPNHWIGLQLVGTDSERYPVGAKVRVHVGDQRQTRWVTAGDGYLSRNEPVVSFGLAEATNVDRIEVLWPSGERQVFGPTQADQRLLLIEGVADPFRLATAMSSAK